MIDQVVEHVRYGRGVVCAFEPPRIEVRFDSDAQVRRFSYPAAVARFLRFQDPEADARAHRDLESENAEGGSRQAVLESIEANRRREEALTENRLNQLRQRRADAAKKAAERRRMALAAKKKNTEV